MSEIKAVKDYQIIIFGLIIAIGAIISTNLFTKGVIKYQKLQNQTITVTGSASKAVKSDFATINFGYKTQSKDLKAGYKKMNENREKIKTFLKSQGVDEQDVQYGLVTSYSVNKKIGNYNTNEIDFYVLNSDVKISSKNIDLVTSISKKLENLVYDDIEIGYSNIEYFVSNIDDIKIEMIGAATKNAKERAKSMVKSTGDSIGSLNSAKTGVFQIVPINSTEVSDYGINDTSSIDKKVVAVVNATFTIK